METYVGNEMELSMLKSAYGDLQYGTSTVVLMGGAHGSGKTTLMKRLTAKTGSHDNLECVEDINTMSPESLKELAGRCKNVGKGNKPCMLVLTYTPMPESGKNASFMAFLSDIRISFQNGIADTELLDIEIKPLKLADVHFLISKLYPENEFHSNFANQIHKASEGNPLMIHSILERMEQDGNLTKQGNGKWLAATSEEIITDIKSQIESAIDSRPGAEEAASAPASATKKYDSAAAIEAAIEELEQMAATYKMAQALETANAVLETLCEMRDTGANYARTIVTKCKALIFFGLYEEAIDCANKSLDSENLPDNETKAITVALQAQAIGYLSQFKEAFARFDYAINIALGCQSHQTAAMIYCMKVPFLLEYPLLGKVKDAYERGIQHCKLANAERQYWELELYYIYYQRYISKTDEGMQRSADVLKYFRGIGDPKFESRTLNVIGLLHSSKCNFEKAGENFAQAISLLKSIDDKVGLIGVYNNMGHLSFDTGQYDSSIEYFQKAFAISSSISSRSLMLVSYVGIGSSLIYLGKNHEAEQSMLKGLELAKTLENKSSMAYAISALGELYSHTGDTAKALDVYLQALEIDRELADMPSIVCDLTNIANVYITTRDVDNGIKYLEGIKEEMPDYADNVVIRAAIDNTFGNLYAEKGDADKAMKHYNAALETNIKCGDHICTSLNYYNMGLLWIDQNDFDKAIECFGNSVKYDRLSGDKMQLAQHLQRLAYCLRTIDEPQQSQQHNMEAASLFRKLGLMDECAISLRAAGDDARAMNIYPNAEKLLLESAEILQTSANYLELADTYAVAGVLYTEMKKPQKAEECFRNAMDLHSKHQLNNYDRYSKIAQQMAWSYAKFKKNDKAIEIFKDMRKGCNPDYYMELTLVIAKMLEENNSPDAEAFYTEAAEIAARQDDMQLKCEVLGEVCEYLSDNGKGQKGIEFVKNAISELEEASGDNRLYKARMLVSLADCHESMNKYDDAIQNYASALKIFDELGEKWDVACVYNNIGYIYDNLSKCADAAHYYHLAFSTYKELDNKESMAKNLYNEALMHERMGDTQNAASLYRHVLDYIDEEENPSGYAATALNVAKCMSTYTDDDEVLKYTYKAYDLFKMTEQVDEMVQCQEFMALFNFQKGNVQAAKSHQSLLLGIKDFKRDSRTQIMVESSAASVCFYINDMDGCMEHFHKAIAIATEIDSWQTIALCNANMAAKMSIDESKYNTQITYNGKTRTIAEFCIECLKFALKIAESEKMEQTISESLELLSNIYENTGDVANMLASIDLAVATCSDDEQRLGMLIRKAIAVKEKLLEPDNALEMMLDIANEAEELGLWETRLMAAIYMCYWRLQENHDDQYAIQTLQHIGQKSGYLLFKVPGLIDFLKKL